MRLKTKLERRPQAGGSRLPKMTLERGTWKSADARQRMDRRRIGADDMVATAQEIALIAARDRLEAEADKYKNKAKDLLLECWHKLGDKLTIAEKDARLIRDHEIRAEVYRTAARMLS